MDVLKSWIVSLSISDVSVFEHSLSLSDAFEQFIAFCVELSHIGQSLALSCSILVNDIVKFNKVLGQHQRVIKDEPEPLFLVIFFGSEYRGHVVIHLSVDWCIPPDL